ncbi:MAG TPA: AAA-like domain-containing protein, partial [Verrucomicrobiae bacterium]|nr:AAA-like domain-containing protein [Verrucomicrobiae bacterium]
MSAEAEVNCGEIPSIPDHQLMRRIGKGAYGEVWLARNALGAYRGVKIVRRSTFEDDRPFRREFDGIQHFEPISRSHPGFVSILHVGPKDATSYFYYVMEVADDVESQQRISPETYAPRTLLEEIHQRGRLPIAECVHIGLTLSAALSHLHHQGLIHRDIKPSNIIFINGTPRLADVGLVSSVRESPSGVGTFGFIPNEGPGTTSADIYGLGKVLYQILTGYAVDQFPSLPTTVVDSEEWPRFSRLNSVILKACAAATRDRYESAEDLHEALLALRTWGGPAAAELEGQAMIEPTRFRARRLVLLGKSSAEPDGRLLQLLQQRLVARGIEVFLDQHLVVGVEWAREIEQKILASDAVVLLFSPASAQSEMLAYQLELAHQAAQQQQGHPIRLPVRVGLAGPWPKELQPFLEPLPDFSWNGPEDDERLVSDVVRALERTTQKIPMREVQARLEPTGGAVDLASKFYVVRPTDDAFRESINRCDSIVLVKGARQMGKTSLLARGLLQARQAGARVALSDSQKLSLQDLESAESFFRALAGLLVDQLDLDMPPNALWDRRRSPNINFERFLRREVLGKLSGRLVWGLDEVDRLFTCS